MKAICTLCDSREVESLFRRRGIPVFQNLITSDPAAARACPRCDLDFHYCKSCGMVFNAAFGETPLPYSADYDNSQTNSSLYQDNLQDLAKYLEEKYELRNKTIVEIGCGKGSLLRRLCHGGRNRGLGFDPSYVGPDTAEGGAVRFTRQFYDGQPLGGNVDFLICQHVLDHVTDPLRTLHNLRQALGERPRASLFCEVPNVFWILENCTFWDFCHERGFYFSPETLVSAFNRAGFEVTRLVAAFAGQYLRLEAKAAGVGPSKAGAGEGPGKTNELVRRFRVEEAAKTAACLARLRGYHHQGGCAIWGAATKGTMLLNLLDPDAELARYVVDINPTKQGNFIPGTGHPIVPPEHLRESPVAGILVMNPIYLEENRRLLKRLGIKVPMECV